MELLYHMFGHILWGYSLKNRSKIYGRYLQSIGSCMAIDLLNPPSLGLLPGESDRLCLFTVNIFDGCIGCIACIGCIGCIPFFFDNRLFKWVVTCCYKEYTQERETSQIIFEVTSHSLLVKSRSLCIIQDLWWFWLHPIFCTDLAG